MTKTAREIIAQLPKKRQDRIKKRGQELVQEEMALQDLRKTMEQTQKEIAAELDMEQGNISRLEKRSDLMISTLRKYVEAMGGKLNLIVEFPDRPPVSISSLSETGQPK